MHAAKAGSKVKILGKDVVSTWKLLTALVVVPFLWIGYSVLVYGISLALSSKAAALRNMVIFFAIYPVLGYATIILGDRGIDIAKSIPPLLVSLGNTVSSSEPLRECRRKLQISLRGLVEEFGPTLFADFEKTRILNRTRKPSVTESHIAKTLGRGKVEWDEKQSWSSLADIMSGLSQ